MALSFGFHHLPLEVEVSVLKNPLYLPPIYIAIALFFIFGIIPPLVFLWTIIKRRWGNTKKPLPPPQYFEFPISADEVKQAKKKKDLAVRFWGTILKTKILEDWKTTQQKENDSTTTTTDVLKIWKQKTRQLLRNELIPQDKYRLLNFTVRISTRNPKEMIIHGCLISLEGPLDEKFMQHVFIEKEISLKNRIMACSDEIQGLLRVIQEPDKFSNDQCCFLCCMKIKKQKGCMGSGQFFIDDMFEIKPVADTTKGEKEAAAAAAANETIRISVSFPVCSKECLVNCVKILHEISQTRDTIIEIRGQQQEEEEQQKEEDT